VAKTPERASSLELAGLGASLLDALPIGLYLVALGLDGHFLQKIDAGITFEGIARDRSNHSGADQKEIIKAEDHHACFCCWVLLDINCNKLISQNNKQIRQDCIPKSQTCQAVGPE
jgi:hypothetical protein